MAPSLSPSKQTEPGTSVVEAETDPNLLLGALEIGIFVSTFLFGVLMTQGRTYWRQRKRDGTMFQVLVVLLLTLEFGHTIACMGTVYYFTVTTAGYSVKPGNCYSFSIAMAFGAFVITLVQTFYVFRCYTFSSNLTLSLIGYSLVLFHVSGTLWITYESWLGVTDPNPFKVQTDFGWLISATLGVGALVDVYAAGSMCWYLIRSLDGIGSIQMFESTTSLVKSLSVWTIETGLATSAASIAVLVCFYFMRFNYIWAAIYLSLTKLYSISFLASSDPSHRFYLLLPTDETHSLQIKPTYDIPNEIWHC
ncbi:hypothetical protein E1B28_007442 [Marasmius oreades]|uniref:DUF6534 domain-containing protein n=1 Tax=Marasmius oreades TaxID=181124 RepID=A0A9P7UVT4_9AGAR|nr:uncharacterized protein E1B28_007442 [Marasmius oreades]KAG7093799.1 hypothetical protein E1B28_007442 [Marasmius oreades]